MGLSIEDLSIFPLVTFDVKLRTWRCLGTGFFLHSEGTFATAKHVFFKNEITAEDTLYGVQTISNGERHVRLVTRIIYHPTADVIVGILGPRKLDDGSRTNPVISPSFKILTSTLKADEEIRTFAFPNSVTIQQKGGTVFGFRGVWSTGKIIDFHETGPSILKHRCYQTSMKIESGASGGPVFKDKYVVGINSSGYNLAEGEEPLSFITPIDYILELQDKELGIQLKNIGS